MDPPSGTDYFEGQPPTLPRMLQPGSESDDDITSARSSDALSDSGSASESDAGSEDEEQDLIEKLVESAGSEIFELVNEIDSAICPPCINIISAFSNGSVPIMTREKRSESSLLHHKTVKGLVECSTTCGICALILHVLDLSGAQFDTLRKPLTAAERELVLGEIGEVLLEAGAVESAYEFHQAVFEKTRGGTGIIDDYGFGKDAIINASGARENMLAKWAAGLYAQKPATQRRCQLDGHTVTHEPFSDCVRNHPECAGSSISPSMNYVLPTRVVGVGLTTDSTPKFFTTVPKRGRTLNYKWGQVDLVRTVVDNFAELQHGIEFSALPATFPDAITINQHLGLRYLWIDSLCIIQNSPEDWLKGAASMPNIYRNSYITIAAATTENCNGGIFVERACVPNSRPAILPVQVASQESHFPIRFDVPFGKDMTSKETDSLQSRAWCIQESLLSHCLLQFDALQIEMQPVLAREERNTFLAHSEYRKHGLSIGDSAMVHRMIISWYDILYNYTRRDLTFPSEKLVAIAGIANIVGRRIHGSYFAGLWENDMPRALLWSPYEEETLPHRCELDGSSCRPTIPQPYSSLSALGLGLDQDGRSKQWRYCTQTDENLRQ
ncbi:het domain containing protein [Drepanopeziza brunnea f. sp. 'multigermtubi' MB_m1]|uniref:Het domain containing protein n=1 Tax=Marssonina brunnea f. sp. multigermtubi (strain MB_m1) TaxID=1072389 RepID=K1XIN7_MARBU|nr:het domain containing protein [Drepanopeziza brunnea f. sp. 'multigermtubi' MB_m1]EKD12349.1 het domain containing protein [Drepanopeziza brunnea f. sp. 'multigermtubi' MB_m1]